MVGIARILRVTAALVLLAAPALAVEAQRLEAGMDLSAQQQVVLTLTKDGAAQEVTLAALGELPRHGAKMETIWDMNGLWEGVRLADLVSAYDLDPAVSIRLRAADDYEVTVSAAEIAAGDPILAYAIDGVLIPPDAMGPLMLIWPADVEKTLAGTAPLTGWIWALDRLEPVAP